MTGRGLAFRRRLRRVLETLIVRSIPVPALALEIGAPLWWPSPLARHAQPEDEPRTGALIAERPALVSENV